MNRKIEHPGVIESIEGDCLRVRIIQTSACAACKVSKHCNASEQKVKMIDVRDAVSARTHSVGDEVVVATGTDAGFRAVAYGFVIPFLVLIAALFAAVGLAKSEAISALISISALALYYLILYLYRGKLQRKFMFHIV